MSQFDNISVKQIFVFSEIIEESSLLQKEFIQERYSRNATNFRETVSFLEDIKLIVIKGNLILPEPRYKAFLEQLKKSKRQDQMIQEFLVANLIGKTNRFAEGIKEFLLQFYLANEQYEFTPTTSQRLKYSGLRNLLIDLGFIRLDSNQQRYVVSDKFFLIYSELREAYQLSPDEFQKFQKKREDIGKTAELQIIEYEKNRLSLHPDLVKRIEHVALKDIMAGYDIRSFEGETGVTGDLTPRYIEVKAVSPWDHKFYWTRNEIEKAISYSRNYYLYLLPVAREKEFDLEGLKIIKDPYMNVYKNENEWTRKEELVTFSLSKD